MDGKTIRKMRKAAGLTLADVARAIGRHPVTLSNIERDAEPNAPTRARAVEYLSSLGAKPQNGRGIVERKDGRVRRRLTVYLPPDLARQLAVRCAENGVEQSAFASNAIAAAIKLDNGADSGATNNNGNGHANHERLPPAMRLLMLDLLAQDAKEA